MVNHQNNPYLQKAVALKYEQDGTSAPMVVAKGSGELAKKIIEKAKEFDVPLFKNEALLNSLMNIELSQEIPPELYKGVVEVFIWLNQQAKK